MLKGQFNQALEKIKNGDNQGLADIYNEYYEIMTFTAFIKVKDTEAAKDIASDFLLYILEKANEISYIESPNAWVFQAIRNQSISYIRKDSKTVRIDDCVATVFSTEPDRDLHSMLMNSFSLLNEKEQQLFMLHYIYGFKYNEISRTLSIPVGSIKRKISEIKEKLKDLKKYM